MGSSPRSAEGQEAFEGELQRFFAQDFGLERFADQRRAGAEHGDLDALQVGVIEQLFLGGGTLAAEAAALADGERHAELGFHQPGEREIEIVAAEEEVLADRGAGEVDQVAFAGDADEAEIAGAAADVADQNDLAIEELLAGRGEVVGDPGIEGRGGLFEQRELLDAGIARGHDGEFARLFVEGGGDGEDDVLLGKRDAFGLVPFLAEFRDEAGGDFDGREHAAGFLGVPGEDFGGAIDIGIGEPRFGGVDQAGGDERALFAGVDADGLAFFEEEEGRQRAARFDASGGDELGSLENVEGRKIAVFRFAFVDVGQGGVGGAQVDADFHAFSSLTGKQWVKPRMDTNAHE